MPNGNTSTQTTPPDGMGGGASPPNTRGDLQAANTAAQAFNNFTGTIEPIAASLGLNEYGMEAIPTDTGVHHPMMDSYFVPTPLEPLESVAPVDPIQAKFDELLSELTTLQGKITSVQSQVSEVAPKAIIAQHKASETIKIAS